mmetsp:Transcript_27796/g.38649  ORF Transcript_27796/g.38649 Transcript_27796/m.38649 type:complete len:108 (+) Transcript_27796:590-913(+)
MMRMLSATALARILGGTDNMTAIVQQPVGRNKNMMAVPMRRRKSQRCVQKVAMIEKIMPTKLEKDIIIRHVDRTCSLDASEPPAIRSEIYPPIGVPMIPAIAMMAEK